MRRNQPASSALAEREHTASGRRATHAELVLDVVRAHPLRTAAEIADRLPFDAVEVRRRLDDLRKQGLVKQDAQRRCTVAWRKAVTWRVAPAAEGEQGSLFTETG